MIIKIVISSFIIWMHLCTGVFAQKVANDFFVVAGINVGYTFGARFNCGITVDLGKIDEAKSGLRYGISGSYYIVRVNTNYRRETKFHRHRSINLMVQSNWWDIKAGYGRMRNGWGHENRNYCIVKGISGDISMNLKGLQGPHLGYRTFLYKKQTWMWFDSYYHTIYLGYENLLYRK